jgi:predicted small integral membrane protein
MIQWHPIFAQLLRPVIEAYYEMETTFPVGDAPREADFVLLRRMTGPPPPFRGLWRNLTPWNVLEFKGPTVSPRRGHLESLVELGLGIDRQLRARTAPSQRRRSPKDMSFWYLANHLGRRFLREAERLLGNLQPAGTGLWRSEVLGRLVFLVSSIDLPVEADSLPLHIVGQEPLATELQVAQLVVEQPKLQQLYGGWMASLHPSAWKEIEAMVRKAGKGLWVDLEPAIEAMGVDRIVETVGIKRFIELLGSKRILDEIGSKRFIEVFGSKRFIEEFGSRRLIQEIGLENLVSNLSPAERRELKRRLQ